MNLILPTCALFYVLNTNATNINGPRNEISWLDQAIRAAPSEASQFDFNSDRSEAIFGQQRYPLLGAYSFGRESAWYDQSNANLVERFQSSRAKPFLSLADKVDSDLQLQIADGYRSLYEPIAIQVAAESEALQIAQFRREVKDLDTEEMDDSFIVDLWEATKSGFISDELIQRYANGREFINGYKPRYYLKLRTDLASRSTTRAVGSYLWRLSLWHLGFGAFHLEKEAVDQTDRFSIYFQNAGSILVNLLRVQPPAHPATLLAIIESGALILKAMDHYHLTSLSIHEKLRSAVHDSIRNLDLQSCELILEDGLISKVKSESGSN